jgi:4-alpha-glucanotransferase
LRLAVAEAAVVVSGERSRLQELAEANGIQTVWQDQLDRPLTVADEVLRKLLTALGVDPDADSEGTSGPPSEQRISEGTRPSRGEERLPAGPRGWGWMVQLYAVRSERSWGIGDFADLTTLVRWTAAHGGDVVLVNPLHAVAPVEPMPPSPYYPASRRWLNPVYLRIEDLPEYTEAEPVRRRQVDALRPAALNTGDRIDRDAVWAAKQEALALLFDPAAVAEPDPDEATFGVWASLAERHGGDWRTWPEELHDPHGDGVRRAGAELAERVRWHVWLQRRSDEQCRAAQQAASDAGMTVGVMHDLAVGTDAGGFDGWLWQSALALGARIGAPPDEFNQQGQEWGMPPWDPRALAEAEYRPLRDMVRAQLARGGGLRIDHILGLFRLWWIPEGDSAKAGAFVRYDADAMLDVIVEEALAAHAVVVGEDLGTVPKQVRETLARRGILGTSLLLFEREDAAGGAAGPLRPLPSWREEATASVTTHDLPTVRGWLAGEHVRLRAELGLLRDVDAEWRTWRAERDELVASLADAGLVEIGANDATVATAMHRALTRTPSRYLMAAPGDAIGDLRQPNLPGTTDEYPNWRLAVTDGDGRPVLLDDLLADPRLQRLAADLAVIRPEPSR